MASHGGAVAWQGIECRPWGADFNGWQGHQGAALNLLAPLTTPVKL